MDGRPNRRNKAAFSNSSGHGLGLISFVYHNNLNWLENVTELTVDLFSLSTIQYFISTGHF